MEISDVIEIIESRIDDDEIKTSIYVDIFDFLFLNDRDLIYDCVKASELFENIAADRYPELFYEEEKEEE